MLLVEYRDASEKSNEYCLWRQIMMEQLAVSEL